MLQLLRHVTIASGGVLPKIHPELLSRKKGSKFSNPPSTAGAGSGHVSAPMTPMTPPPIKKPKPMPRTPAARKIPPKKAVTMVGKGKGKPPSKASLKAAPVKTAPAKAAKVSRECKPCAQDHLIYIER